ncbi:hypothetical protein [Pseudophaeobacter sp.]|uniref:hypothetical protein n=1 Tax=Pseudophaeobacter sp. TaxID=1971739 RepID=UPI003299F17A
MQTTPTNLEETVIGQVLRKFISGDVSLFELISEDIDFRIDHFRDEVDVSWQKAKSREGMIEVIARLGQEVFPKGTKALGLESVDLGNGWHLTRFEQEFFYGVRQCDVSSLTFIVSHEADGFLDFFRETVTNVTDI